MHPNIHEYMKLVNWIRPSVSQVHFFPRGLAVAAVFAPGTGCADLTPHMYYLDIHDLRKFHAFPC
jgi:hypothetical protein